MRIITELNDLEIDPTDYETQYDAKRLIGSRSLILDVHGGDKAGRKYDLEMEKSNASPERLEAHISAMVTEHLNAGDDFSDLPIIYVIFVCDHDEVGNGRAVNEFIYLNSDRFKGSPEIENKITAHESMGGRTHILLVNGDYKDDESQIGRLIHDLKCTNADDMYYDNLARKTRELKETTKGVETVCAVIEQERKLSENENTLKILLNVMKNQNWDVEKAMDVIGIEDDQRDLYARSAMHALNNQS